MSDMKNGILAYNESDLQSIESWLGGQVDVVTTTWSEGQWGLSGISWNAENKASSLERVFGQTDRQLIAHFEMAGKEGNNGDYSKAARGGYDSQYRQTARELVDIDMTDTIIRPSAEFNMSWGPRYPNNPDNYASAFARVVREMNSVSGTNFTYLYSPARNKIGVADECWPLDAPEWPSNAAVPPIAPSFYDDSWHYDGKTASEVTDTDRAKAWDDEKTKLDRWQNFADNRGSPGLCSPEWGLVTIGGTLPGAGDNPYFIQKTMEYMHDNDWLFQAYWNDGRVGDTGDTRKLINPTDNPNAKAKFKELVTLSGSGGTDQTDDTTTKIYGNYDQPAAGTLNWHIPLNENFSNIEADIKDLADRVNQLEGNN
jgi:hypothetical protein